jgi:hypothetical protein
MNRLKTTDVVRGIAATSKGRHRRVGTGSRKRRFERVLAAFTGTALVMSLMIVIASPALAHHPIPSVTAECDDVGNRVVTWTVSNGNWEGKSMTIDQVTYTDSTSGWTSIFVGLTLGPNGSASETVTYPLSDTGTKTLTIRADWTGGSQDVVGSLSHKLKDLKCEDTTSTTVKDTTTTTDKDTTTTTDKDTTTTTVDDTTTTTGGETTTTQSTTTTVDGTSSTTDDTTTSTGATIPNSVPTTEPGSTDSTVDDDVLGTVITTSTVADEVDDLVILPFTGSNTDALIVLAVSALILGGIMVMSARGDES